LRHGNIVDEERRKHRRNQRESHGNSSFESGVAAAGQVATDEKIGNGVLRFSGTHVDRFCDDLAWCEAIGHRSIS
jgi:hypothetical protein